MDISSWQNLLEWVRADKAERPITLSIPSNQVDPKLNDEELVTKDTHYFYARVNELFLNNRREWLSLYDPLVFVVSEFIYDNDKKTIPFVVGPTTLLENFSEKIPEGMIFNNTRVAGIHPYRGGTFAFSIVLCRLKRKDFSRELLQVVEKTAKALDFSTALESYTKLSTVILDGVDSLLGSKETEPLVGLRTEFDPGIDESFKPSYFVIIDAPELSIDKSQLWVQDNHLLYGSNLDDAVPFREASYVLYSIGTTNSRNDEANLPFHSLYEQVLKAATQPNEESWKRAKANMITLYQELLLSPDLIPTQAEELCDKYMAKMQNAKERVKNINRLGTDGEETQTEEISEIQAKLRDSVNILDL